MKHAFVARLALCGAAVLAWPTVMQASSSQLPMQLAHAHGAKAHNSHGHDHHAHQAPSQESIAAMPVAPSVAIADCWIRLLPLPAPSAGYFKTANKGDGSVTLTGAASARYGQVMLHQTTHTDGMSRMSSVEGVEIPAGQTLEFKPGSYHIMLEKPTDEIKVGDTVAMQFLFESGEKAEADCDVKPANTLAK
ncbi:copper chaperone PCu(A)C [Pusillimonas sp.]|uniref:copper chaperone PCu(A)C n=1 Tax=Pusillimonas sp. TaxID=3040095 RepID=UPI0037C5F72B